jgi:hypothetical protein
MKMNNRQFEELKSTIMGGFWLLFIVICFATGKFTVSIGTVVTLAAIGLAGGFAIAFLVSCAVTIYEEWQEPELRADMKKALIKYPLIFIGVIVLFALITGGNFN